MTRDDINRLRVGNSVIGLWNQWVDELPIVAVGEPVARADGRLVRVVTVQSGPMHLRGTVREGDSTIRGEWR